MEKSSTKPEPLVKSESSSTYRASQILPHALRISEGGLIASLFGGATAASAATSARALAVGHGGTLIASDRDTHIHISTPVVKEESAIPTINLTDDIDVGDVKEGVGANIGGKVIQKEGLASSRSEDSDEEAPARMNITVKKLTAKSVSGGVGFNIGGTVKQIKRTAVVSEATVSSTSTVVKDTREEKSDRKHGKSADIRPK